MRRLLLTGFFVAVFAAAASPAAAQSGTDIVIGKKIILHSEALKEDREILISKPGSYDKGQDRYPVLYVLDGEANFQYATGIVRFRAMYGLSPNMIVIGIVNTDRNRDLTPTRAKVSWDGKVEDWLKTTGGGDVMLKFIEAELIPYVEAHFRTRPFRLLTGHSFGALFVMHAFLARPDLFNAFIAVSPSFWYDDKLLLKRAEARLSSLPVSDRFLYFSVGGKEEEVQVGDNQRFARLLRETPPAGLKWKYEYLSVDTHGSQGLRGLYNGLEFVFGEPSFPPTTP